MFFSKWHKKKHFRGNVIETRNAVNNFRKIVNLFSKTTVNHIRK